MNVDPEFSMEQLLENLLLEDEQFTELEMEFRQYCPFAAMGIVHAEIRHGNFLSQMLDPRQPHGYGGNLLRAFLTAAIKAARNEFDIDVADVSPLDIHLLDLEDARVFREWRNMDIVIVCETAKIVIAIELKINAGQTSGQLRRYRDTINDEWKGSDWRKLFIFLTKAQDDPEDEQAKFWIPFGLDKLVNALEAPSKAQGADPMARSMLAAYLTMLRREHLKNDRLEKLVSELWSRHGPALLYLSDRKPDALANVISRLAENRNDIVQLLDAKGGIWAFDSVVPRIVRFAYLPWETIPDFHQSESWSETRRFLLFEIKREGDYINGYLYLGPGPDQYRTQLVEALRPNKLSHPKARIGKVFAALAKSCLFDATKVDEIEQESVTLQIQSDFIKFAHETVTHFNPCLSALKQHEGDRIP